MPKKKVSKSVKSKSKKVTRTQSKPKAVMTNSVDHLEKSFKQFPNQIATQCRKELATLKQQEKKLASELKKAVSLTKAIEHKCAALSKQKSSATVKKQLASATLGFKKANLASVEMSRSLEKIKLQIAALASTANKFSALTKEINKFDKEWTIKAKQAAATLAAKKSAKKAAKKKVSKSKAAKEEVKKIISSIQDTVATISHQDEAIETESTDETTTS